MFCFPVSPSLESYTQIDLVLWGSHAPCGLCLSPRPCGPLCRFSHGQVVSVDELRPFQDPDLSSLQAGSACLAKQPDGLWYPARITGEAAHGPSSVPSGRPLHSSYMLIPYDHSFG